MNNMINNVMNTLTHLVHWKLQRDADGTAWAILDRQNASTNVLTVEVMAELTTLLDECDRQVPKALIFKSGKAAGFIAGADIEELARLDSGAAAHALIKRGWDLYNRLAIVAYPTLALIRGHCLGGGAELALACRYRIAVDEAQTKIALPEVMLGIVPGWGGMLRLPQKVGAGVALDMMLTGKNIDARRAKRMGLVDALRAAARDGQRRAHASRIPASRHARLSFFQRLLNGPLKGLVAAQARRQVARRARPEHYPAPYAILDMWAKVRWQCAARWRQSEPTSLDRADQFIYYDKKSVAGFLFAGALEGVSAKGRLHARFIPQPCACRWRGRHGWRHCRMVRLVVA
jgi:3-hydroxyacyl-CoA dehydrogenase/enoyl-CoA hydratase/3-hydroxybutyryl-CoA epimerase